MSGKSKFDYEAEEFEKNFLKHKSKRIALYGIGRMTATLLERIKGFSIVGLLDKDENLIGTELYGVKIIRQEEAEKEADMIIINTAEVYWETIYQRIRNWNIPIYFRNGELAEEKACDSAEIWKGSFTEIRQKVEDAEVVSFDVFDTLVMRKFLFPVDVFRIVDKKVKSLYGIDFFDVRKRVVSLLYEPTINEIYEKIQEIEEWGEELVNEIKLIEIETDLSNIVPRYDMVTLCNETMNEKEVYFVSDMYYTSDILFRVLSQCGLQVKREQIIVSCEQKKSKINADLWIYYKEKIVKGRKALHIGDNIKSDIEEAQRQGLDTFYVMSSYTMLQHSSIKKIVPDICSLYASASVGLICSKLFNSPFALHDAKGKIHFQSNKQAGYCILGSFLFSFITWLMRIAKIHKIDTLAFLARDGYLLIQEYEYLCDLLQTEKFPKAVYLEISRRTIMNASVEKAEDIYAITKFPYSGTVNEFLQKRFAVKDKSEFGDMSVVEIQKRGYSLEQIVESMYNVIFQQTQEEKISYLAYLNSLDLSDNFAIVDTMLYGTTQYYLGKLLHRKLKGYYFSACVEENSKNLEMNEMYGCFQKSGDSSGKDTYICKNSIFSDAFFTSPEGMLLYINEKGEKKYAPKMSNQKFFGVREEMQQGIFEFFQDILEMQMEKEIDKMEADNYFADELLGIFLGGGFVPTEDMKKGFFFDNALLSDRESSLWE